MRSAALPVFRITAVVKYPNQRNRRERPACRSGSAANTTRADERNRSPTCHSEGAKRVEESSQVARFILCWFFLQRGGFLRSAVAQGLNDKGGTFLRIRQLFLQCFTLPRGPHQARPGEPASPKGSSCTVLLGLWFAGTAQGKAPRPSPSGKGDRHRRGSAVPRSAL